MITVKIHGGLGNQMFQYAMARALSLRTEEEFSIDPSSLFDPTPWKGMVYRTYGLSEVFKIDPKFNFAAQFESHVRIPYFAKVFNKYYPRILAQLGYWRSVGDENPHVFNPAILSLRGSIYLNGYWQSEKYFKDYEDTIRADFSFRSPLEGATATLAEEIETANSVSLFVRRKEVVSNPVYKKMYYFATPEFYEKAVAMMKKKIGKNAIFYISSDEINWCRENFKIDAEHVFVGEEHNGPECGNALNLMALCKHFIIPNSTFPWWAAWLSLNKEKVVISPRQWLEGEDLEKTDILPESWIRL